jgi:hypothetical protein
MPRRKRLEFHGAIHMVRVGGRSGANVFYDPQTLRQHPENPRGSAPDVQHFEALLWDTCEQYEAKVHAYAVEQNTALIVVQRYGAPLNWIMHDVLTRYSMYLIERSRIPEGERPFPRRYEAQLIQPGKLPYVVRYLHRRQFGADPRRRAVNHPFSSNLIYCGRKPQPACMITSATRAALATLGYPGPSGYLEFMARSDSPPIAHMLSQSVIGDPAFRELMRKRHPGPTAQPSPDEILQEVAAALLHSEPDVVCSSTHRGALARAIVAWYAMRTGTAQIGTVGRWFGVTSSDLRFLIREHRKKNPQYFSRPLPELFPALSAEKPEAGGFPSPNVRELA